MTLLPTGPAVPRTQVPLRRRSGSPAHRATPASPGCSSPRPLVGFLVFAVYPTLRGIYLSFTDFQRAHARRVGRPRQLRAARQRRRLLGVVRVTVVLCLCQSALRRSLALAIAVLLHRLTTSTRAPRLIVLPYLVSNVVAGIVWLWMLDTQLGIGNIVIGALGCDRHPVPELDETWAIPTIALINVWKPMSATPRSSSSPGCRPSRPTMYEAGRRSTARASGGCSGGSRCRCCGRSSPWS